MCSTEKTRQRLQDQVISLRQANGSRVSNQSTSTALITGASSGIGLELARLFAADAHNVVLVARNQEKLNRLAEELRNDYHVETQVITSDLAATNAIENLILELKKSQVQIDYLVNNAGFGAVGKVADIPLNRQSSMVQVNVTALTELTRSLLPSMIEKGRGGILNVASTAAFQPGPGMAVYYATKAYVLSFTEALHEEMRGGPIKVACLAPGPTATGFGEDSGMKASRLFRLGAMDARSVALAGYRGLMRNQPIVIPGLKNKLGALSIRFTPRFLARLIVGKLNQPAKS